MNSISGKYSRFRATLAVILYLVVLHIIYYSIVTPSFSYMGYTYNPDLDFTNFISLLVFSLLPLLFLRLDSGRPSNFVILLQYILVYIPTQYVLTIIDPTVSNALYLRVTLLIALAFLTFASANKIPIGFLFRITPSLFKVFIFSLFILLLALVVSQFGLKINFVSFSDVYDVRSEYKGDVQDAGRIFGYAVPYLGIISAFMVGYGYANKYFPFLASGIVSLLYIFGFTGQKSTLFSALLVIGLTLLYRGNTSRFAEKMIGYTAIIIGISAVADSLLGGVIFTSLFARRTVLTPGLLTVYYFNFFSQNPPALLAHSFLSSVFSYPYDLKPPFLIGREYFASATLSANANMFADGFSNFREAGAIIFSVILGIILAVVDGYSKGIERPLILVAGIALPAFSLTNSALFTTFLTHGFALAILITYMYASSENLNSESVIEEAGSNRSRQT